MVALRTRASFWVVETQSKLGESCDRKALEQVRSSLPRPVLVQLEVGVSMAVNRLAKEVGRGVGGVEVCCMAAGLR